MPVALIIDDEAKSLAAMTELVEKEGFSTMSAGSLAEARDQLAQTRPDVILVDQMLPDGNGLDLLQALEPGSRPEIILITGHASVDSAVAALRVGVLDYLTKPVDIRRLKTVLANVSRTLALKEEIGSLRGELRELGRFGRLIGNSQIMQKVYDLVVKVAPTEATVLLVGESGTGKEEVAATIHELGRRRGQAFLPVNCGAVPANLIESELFGHERGSFTGATQLHRGYFERVSRGTLFLDEITEMPLELQVKLLRVLETGTLLRVGGDEPISVDVRVIAASNRPPETAVKEGKFREDLLYRLNVFPIVLPPLRDRGSDINLLAEHFLAQINREEGTSKKFGAAALRRIAAYSWPGNVRELKNMIRRAFILSEDVVEMDALPVGPAARAVSAAPSSNDAMQVGMSLAEIERHFILATLEHFGGDKRKAAEVLGISLKTIYNRLNNYSATV
ncbi:MAG: sigma-54-dependent Fis family transcriptional regulator [Candidatus Eisenbacteria bacterium]|uniref:Sigma-54-dependent Fis family transcriptional regulator n=1 Tax=Eiseniibacteriota bacterium TaxID=2212470 RepID=A0A538SPN6_UNCEI|nr:MAG: sigma-54-dependent Fis family transcriptional regulator [Candidatus Eisenbacteria bacterium]